MSPVSPYRSAAYNGGGSRPVWIIKLVGGAPTSRAGARPQRRPHTCASPLLHLPPALSPAGSGGFWRSRMSWTDDRVERLRNMWADGLSCSRIAAALGGVTRNAVIGKASRLGLSSRNRAPRKRLSPRIKRQRPVVPKQSRSGSWAPSSPKAPQWLCEPTATQVSLLDLEPHHCRWPISEYDGPVQGFCGARKVPGTSYCATHAAKACRLPTVDRDTNSIRTKEMA